MIVCTHCQAKNSVDSAFCKSCGREVLEADRETAREENSKLIAEGYSLLAEGRTEEAELVARAGIEADERAAAAYSLLGMCHERRDDIVAALECYERVVELNPESSLDKIKVTQLRNVLARRVDAEPAPSRRNAFVAAISAVVLVGAIGALAAILTQPTEAKAATKTEPTGGIINNQQGFGDIPDGATKVPQGTQLQNPQIDPNQQANNAAQGNANPPNNGGGNNGYNPPRNNYNLGSGNAGDGRLAAVDNNTNQSNPFEPVRPDLGVQPREEPKPLGDNNTSAAPPNNGGNTSNSGAGDDPGPINGGGNTGGSSAGSKSTGSIMITPSKGNGQGNGGGGQIIPDESRESNGNGLKALVRTANQQMLTGNYDGAARSLEQARSRGGDNGSVNKKLAQCYERMGKKSDAIQLYRSAKKHLESSNDPAAKSQLDVVNQALKNLGGS